MIAAAVLAAALATPMPLPVMTGDGLPPCPPTKTTPCIGWRTPPPVPAPSCAPNERTLSRTASSVLCVPRNEPLPTCEQHFHAALALIDRDIAHLSKAADAQKAHDAKRAEREIALAQADLASASLQADACSTKAAP